MGTDHSSKPDVACPPIALTLREIVAAGGEAIGESARRSLAWRRSIPPAPGPRLPHQPQISLAARGHARRRRDPGSRRPRRHTIPHREQSYAYYARAVALFNQAQRPGYTRAPWSSGRGGGPGRRGGSPRGDRRRGAHRRGRAHRRGLGRGQAPRSGKRACTPASPSITVVRSGALRAAFRRGDRRRRPRHGARRALDQDPQVGAVRIGSDVEIGANISTRRATTRSSRTA